MSYKTCAFTPPFLLRNFAHGNVARHNEIVVESNAYFFPEMSRMLVVRFLVKTEQTVTAKTAMLLQF